MNTRLSYAYSDGGGIRFHSEVILDGAMTGAHWGRILRACDDHQFIAHQVGLREVFGFLPGHHVHPDEYRETGYPYDEEIDHCWHHFGPNAWELTSEPRTIPLSVIELVALFEAAARAGWQIFDPAERFGL